MIRFICPTCKKIAETPDERAGEKMACPGCGQRLLIPAPQGAINKTVLGMPAPSTLTSGSLKACEIDSKPESGPKVTLSCPNCGRKLTAKGFTLGSKARCPSCRSVMSFSPVVAEPGTPGSASESTSAEIPGQGPEIPRPSRGGIGYAIFGLALGIAALPVGLALSENISGLLLSALGLFVGLFALLVSVTRHGKGLGLSAVCLLVCGSSLLTLIFLASGPKGSRLTIQERLTKDGHTNAHADEQASTVVSSNGVRSPAKEEVEEDDDPEKVLARLKGRKSSAAKPIRLSGIHKPAAGGFILQAQDHHSDIDLWKDNPVEADAKWRGRIVDVEMAASDLRVVQNRKGDTAALETPQNEIWGREHGWQLTFFIFHGDNRMQLTGFQNRSGDVVIRGECQGLDGSSYVTFDNCEILAEPAVHSPAASRSGSRQGKSSPKSRLDFDANDLGNTLDWATAAAKALYKDVDNAIRFRESLEKFNQEGKRYVGKKVRWSLEIAEIRDSEVILIDRYTLGKVSPSLFGPAFAELAPHLELRGPKDEAHWRGIILSIGDGIATEKARRLHPGDVVPITAEVDGVSMKTPHNRSTVGLHVSISLAHIQGE